jgi:hypothetical protein
MSRLLGLIFGALVLLAVPIGPALAAACTAGVLNCTTDTVNDRQIVAALVNPNFQQRVYDLFVQQCFSVWSEAASTAGHPQRSAFCQRITNGGPSLTLAAAVMTSTVQSQILSGTCVLPGSVSSDLGCAVDADINTAIAIAFTVTVNTAATTATAASGSTALTVASATGIAPGQNVYAAGVPSVSGTPTVVLFVSGTTVYINNPTTAALSATPIVFTVSAGLP